MTTQLDQESPPGVDAKPCGSCPYRRDVPSGIWAAEEYAKLPLFDGDTWQQDQHLFRCHQQTGKLCAGWLGCHGPKQLLALRMYEVEASVYSYVCPVPVFSSGAEAAAHGMRDIKAPDPRASRMVEGLIRKRGVAR